MTTSLTRAGLTSYLASCPPERLRQIDLLLAAGPETILLEWLHQNPARLMSGAGYSPDPWQADVLSSDDSRLLLLCARQCGKSTCAAALALRTALFRPRALVLLLSHTLRQSGELFRAHVLPLWHGLGAPLGAKKPTALTLELANGSRIVSLPENEEGIRCYSAVNLLVIDEASRVSDALYSAVRPMLSMSRGRLVALSTPFGKRGWFFDTWEEGGPAWRRVKVTAPECPRHSSEFLEEERLSLGGRWYNQEYECVFADAIDSVFGYADVAAAVRQDVLPLDLG